jgi:sec-independent protein translocase protein TatA
MRLGMGEIVLILAIALLVFGPTKLPQLGEALGKAIRSFRRASEAPEEVAVEKVEQEKLAPRTPAAATTAEARAAEAKKA